MEIHLSITDQKQQSSNWIYMYTMYMYLYLDHGCVMEATVRKHSALSYTTYNYSAPLHKRKCKYTPIETRQGKQFQKTAILSH